MRAILKIPLTLQCEKHIQDRERHFPAGAVQRSRRCGACKRFVFDYGGAKRPAQQTGQLLFRVGDQLVLSRCDTQEFSRLQ